MADIELELTCNICLDLLTEPHQYPCGHSFCLQCIDQLWSRQSFNCPDCRRTCPDRREIVRNFRLQNIVEAYRLNGNTLVRSTMNEDQSINLRTSVFFVTLDGYRVNSLEV